MTNNKKVLIALLTIVFIPLVTPINSVSASRSEISQEVVSEKNLISSEVKIVKVSNIRIDSKVSDKVINSKNTLPKQPVVNTVVQSTNVNYPVYTVEEIKAKICEAFGSECANALIIAKAESGYRQFVISKTNDYGVFQLNCRWQKRRVGGDCSRFFDVDTNIRIAKQIYTEQGWNPWTTKIYLPKR